MSVLLNNGDGTFGAQVAYPTGPYPTHVVASDLNGDGAPDLTVTNFNFGDVSVLLNNGDGTFGAQVLYTTGKGSVAVTTADLDGDGVPDLAVANQNDNNVSVLLTRCLSTP